MRIFLNLVNCICAEIFSGERLPFSVEQLKIGLCSFKRLKEISEPNSLCSYFVTKSTNPRSALQVVQISRCLVLEIRYMNEITSSFVLIIIWGRTQFIPIKKETTVEKDWSICVE